MSESPKVKEITRYTLGVYAQTALKEVPEMRANHDVDGMIAMIEEGRVIELRKGTPIYLVYADFMGPVLVRIKGTTSPVWIDAEALSP